MTGFDEVWSSPDGSQRVQVPVIDGRVNVSYDLLTQMLRDLGWTLEASQ